MEEYKHLLQMENDWDETEMCQKRMMEI